MNIVFITNICAHYVRRLFELLAIRCNMEFYFTGGHESYWERKNKISPGDFHGWYLRGFFLAPGFRITPGLFRLLFKNVNIFIKTLDDRFALFFIFLVSRLRNKSFILWTGLWHHPQTWLHKKTFWITRMIYRHSEAIVVYGAHVKKYLEDLDIDSRKIFIAPHSVDNRCFNKRVSEEEKCQLKVSLGMSDGKIILYVGRLEECKGLDDLIKGAGDMHKIPFHLLFIGDGTIGRRLERECRKRAISCKFLNHISNEELYRYYAIADIFVLPSITTKDFKEPWGLVINEAMNQGCPVIATTAVGAAMGGLVEDGETGFIVPERNPEALSRAMEKILENDHLRVSMRQAAVEKIQHWTHEKMREGFIRAIDYATKRRDRSGL